MAKIESVKVPMVQTPVDVFELMSMIQLALTEAGWITVLLTTGKAKIEFTAERPK